MPHFTDYLFIALFAGALPLIEHFVFWPRFRAAIASGAGSARIKGYRRVSIGQWLFAAAALAMWSADGRSMSALGLVPPTGWRLGASFGVAIAILALAALQLRSVAAATPEQRQALGARLGRVGEILPRTRADHRWFMVLSLTAGVCEELLYRGFLIWVLRASMGLPAAAVLGVILFGAGHAYQGTSGLIKATAAGAVMTLIVLGTGWLIPAMIVHAVLDASGGTVGYALLGEDRGGVNALARSS
jgi:membrane protease YdiL (CAAX protease family)